jgi:hypothetical protein
VNLYLFSGNENTGIMVFPYKQCGGIFAKFLINNRIQEIQLSGMKKKIEQQVYLIKETNCEKVKTTRFVEYIFMDYSESRRMAWKIVRKLNMKKSVNEFSINYNGSRELKEITPDLWTDGNTSISIEVFQYKDIAYKNKKSKTNDRIQNLKELISNEIYITKSEEVRVDMK